MKTRANKRSDRSLVLRCQSPKGEGGLVLRSPSPKGEGGFTLIEVLIAMAIIGVTAVVLLDQRITIVQDAGRARDKRTCWVLAAQRLAEMELDRTLWQGQGGQNNGDFSDVDPEYGPFLWEYQIVREVIETGDPAQAKQQQKDDSKKKEVFRLTLSVRAPGIDEPVVLEAEFPTSVGQEPPKTDAAVPSGAAASPSGGTGAPAPAPPSRGPQK